MKRINFLMVRYAILILLSLINACYADETISYPHAVQQIKKGQTFGVQYNLLKSTAIVELLNGIIININFNTKKKYLISNNWPGLVTATWLNNKIAHIQGSCGTECAKSIIFVAPSTSISCSTHDYRIKSLNPHYPGFFFT